MRRDIVVFKPAASDGPPSVEGLRLPLGSQEDVRAALSEAWGQGTWQAPDQGMFDGAGFSVLATLGILPTVETIALEVWGDVDPTPQIRRLCAPRQWRAMDLITWKAIDEPAK
jgi:hypothetical protein